ncbi:MULTISPECIES: DUF481 domain-containing protein [unclassified Luteimonas]|jgi:hypothetical protein|uniref:DUF481 domain-containing protein n=1 Tax=unclassified Luteimonas TaxID=2629088 RepID=UPI00160DD38B|nr:DUF481 domain-containing protein [Luteimonas sp. RC10]MBB3345329.1 hypothetical protein [Luteimonas sp. RC10]
MAVMLAGWWLAFAGLPIYTQPLPAAPEQPAVLAVATRQVPLRRPCFRLKCTDAEWTASAARRRIWAPRAPGVRPKSVAPPVIRLPDRPAIALYSPFAQRDSFRSGGNHVKWDTSYGIEAIRSPETSLRLEFGTGVRIEPYTDFGTAVPGPVARGQLQLSQELGRRASFTQQVQVETGRENTFLRQTLAFDYELFPQWTLRSDFELRHDTLGNGGRGSTDTESSLKVQYQF